MNIRVLETYYPLINVLNVKHNMSEQELLKLLALYKAYTSAPFDIQNYDSRLLLQKIVCAVECVGSKNFTYNFGWHLRGPYSSVLASDIYKLDENLPEYEKKLEESPDIMDTISNETNFLEDLKIILPEDNYLELYSSVLFLEIIEKKSEDEIFNTIKVTKPWYDTSSIQESINQTRILVQKSSNSFS